MKTNFAGMVVAVDMGGAALCVCRLPDDESSARRAMAGLLMVGATAGFGRTRDEARRHCLTAVRQ